MLFCPGFCRGRYPDSCRYSQNLFAVKQGPPPPLDSLISNREASQTRSRSVSSLPTLSPCHISTPDLFPPPHNWSYCSPTRSVFRRAVVPSLPLPPAFESFLINCRFAGSEKHSAMLAATFGPTSGTCSSSSCFAAANSSSEENCSASNCPVRSPTS